MGVYSQKGTILESTIDVDAIECTMEAGLGAALNIVAESEENYNRLMQAVGVQELAAFEATGVEMVYESADIKSFFGKVKQFFLNVLAKIKGLFQKFFAMFDSYAKSDKDFINKYRKQIVSANTKDFKYSGYKFSNLKLDLYKANADAEKACGSKLGTDMASIPTSESTLDGIITKAGETSEIVEAMRGATIGKGSLEAAEFTKELFQLFRSGEDSKSELDNISPSDELQHIGESKDLKKAAEDSLKDIEKLINAMIKSTDNYEKELLKNTEKEGAGLRAKQINVASKFSAFHKDLLAIIQTVNGAKLTAIKDQNRQSKAICVKLLTHSPKHEGADLGTEGDSYISSVVFK